MTGATDSYLQWDAAYVLGALSVKERLEFERHLATCAECSAAVADLAGLPGLLAKVSENDIDAVPPPAPDLLPQLARATRRRRVRSRLLAVGTAVAAAAAAAVLAIVIPLAGPAAAPPVAEQATLSQVVPSPLSANIRLIALDWGTTIEMTCRYTAASPAASQAPARDYAMYVTDRGGNSAQVATWAAAPGSTVTLSGATSLKTDAIGSVDVRSVSSGRVLLKTVLPEGVSPQ
ncbi:zf-HC2 domain-containing protein [Parafrigoribacterium mesophilum]|uniref:anti-sigma factor family protein n=1 Tax=Parafrigoribacterium mesophilum TaxID=433646 RepID=UPI0031FBC6D3